MHKQATNYEIKEISLKKLKIAFLLNVFFAVFEIFAGLMTNSVAILSDAIHDFGDSLVLGISIILTKLSKKQPNSKYTYGYLRYSTLGAFINLVILFCGSVPILILSIKRLFEPQVVASKTMIFVAIIGILVNILGAVQLNRGSSLVERSVMLHLLEDILGWIALLIISVVMNFTDFYILDPMLSIIISIIIIINVIRNGKNVFDVFMQKIPVTLNYQTAFNIINEHENVALIDDLKIWTIDGERGIITMKIEIVDQKQKKITKNEIRKELENINYIDVTIEIENE